LEIVLLISVFVIATCGLVYELISGTLASYLLGDSVTQFSTVVGVYLFSMGIGSYLSKFIHRNIVGLFIQVELILGLIGGSSAALLFLAFPHVNSFRVLLYSQVCIVGTLVGLEIPLLLRILKDRFEFKDLVSKVFTFDYVGALVASLLFPLLLVPHLGLVRSSFLFGMLNVAVAIWALYLFRQDLKWLSLMRVSSLLVFATLLAGFVYSDKLVAFSEASIYDDEIIFAKSSPYQRIVITRSPKGVSLFLNGHLQFNSRDEYRYHEALVHVGLQGIANPKQVLVLGGGDGMAVREILKYPGVEAIRLVDLDADVTTLFSTNDALIRLNGAALQSPKVHIINQDAFIWLRENDNRYDFVVVDFPDPSNFSVGKLYTTAFYELLSNSVAPGGAVVVQSTSPYVAPKSFWCIERTLQSVGFATVPYHAHVPSFGEWGFVLASHQPFKVPGRFLPGLKFINAESIGTLLTFPADMKQVPTEINKLNNQVLVRYFDEEWADYAQ
jgi:spermidine synthase